MLYLDWVIGFMPSLKHCSQAGRSDKSCVGRHSRARAHTNPALDTLFETVKPRKVLGQFNHFWENAGYGEGIDRQWQEILSFAGDAHAGSSHPLEKVTHINDQIANNGKIAQGFKSNRRFAIPNVGYTDNAGQPLDAVNP